MTTRLAVRNVTRRFGGIVANDDVSLTVDTGEIHAVIGPNGAGKTTLVAQIAGEIAPDEGAILIDGADVTARPPHARALAGLGRSFQVTSVMPSLSVEEHVLLAAARGTASLVRAPRASDRSDAALARTGLAARRASLAADLSHGERRQLEMAMVLAANAGVLVLDEPAAGMGADESRSLAELLRDLRASHAILLVEHDMDLVFAVADRITVLVGGRVAASGTPAAIKDNAAVRAAYLGADA